MSLVKAISPTVVCVVAVLAPLPFGSGEPFWGAVWSILLAIALIVAAPPRADRRLQSAILLALFVVAGWCLIVALQYTPAGGFLASGPGWRQAAALLGDHMVTPKPAAYGELPIAAVVPPMALVLALLSGLICGSQPGFTGRIYLWVSIAGLVYAAYGIFAEVSNPTMLLWQQRASYFDSVTGTFVNHNTAATFFGSIAVIWYLWALRQIRYWFDFSRWSDFGYVARKVGALKFKRIWLTLAFFVALATTLMTRSRAGSLLTLVTLALVTVLYFAREIKSGRRRLIGLAVLAAGGALLLAIAGGQLENRIETQGVFDAGRWDTWTSSLSIIKDHPWLGTGLGTFAGVFPAYRSPAAGVWGVWDRAHSTPIELMVEMGIPFSILVFVSWSLMLATMVRASQRGIDNRIYVVAGAGIGGLATLHSLVDFPLQIPGFSVVCCVLLGASLATALTATTESAVAVRGSIPGNSEIKAVPQSCLRTTRIGTSVRPDANKVEDESPRLTAATDGTG